MLIQLKITRALHDTLIHDLERPHSFAYERVGFLLIKRGTMDADILLLLGGEYLAVKDENYIDDPDVGAKINSAAIRSVMERAMAGGYGIIHVHLHDKLIGSAFSKTDRHEFKKLVPSFHNIGGGAVHGAAVFSGNCFTAFVQLRKDADPIEVSRVSVVGYPISEYVPERSRLWKMKDTADKVF
jgi:hypothetical protein